MTKRLLVFGKTPPPVGGVTMHTARLAAWLDHFGHSVDVSARPIALLRGIVTRRYQVVHIQTYTLLPVFAALFLRLFLRPLRVVYSIHSEYFFRNKFTGFWGRVRKSIFRHVDTVICDSAAIAEDMSFCRTTVISPFLPPTTAGTFDLKQIEGVTPDLPTVVFNAYKIVYNAEGGDVYGFETYLRAILTLDRQANFVMAIPQFADEDKAVFDRVCAEYPDAVNRDHIHILSDATLSLFDLFLVSDVFVRPTITDGDALSVHEALLVDLKVIASDCCRRPEGTTLFRTSDVADLSAKMADALDTPGLSASQPDQLMQNIEQFSQNAITEYARVYAGSPR